MAAMGGGGLAAALPILRKSARLNTVDLFNQKKSGNA